MKVTVAHSEDIDTSDAINEILESCSVDFGDLVPQAGMFVSSAFHDFDMLTSRILERYPDLELMGCSSNAEISSVMGLAEDSVVLMLLRSDRVTMKVGIGKNVSTDPKGAASEAIEKAAKGMDDRPSMCVTLPEVWNVSVRELLDGLEEALGPDVPIYGGQASNETHSGMTIQCCKAEVLSDAVPVMLFYGPLKISSGVNSGWKPIGTEYTITRAEGNIVYTIDGRPAEELFIEYFGDIGTFFPIAVFPEDDDQFYMATPAKALDDGGVFFYNYVGEGARFRFADASPDEIIAAAAVSSEEAVSLFPGDRPAAGMLFSCAGRIASLGSRTKEEVQLLRDQLGEDIPLIGFYSSGELCPLKGHRTTQTHGGTFATVLFGES